MSVKKLFAYSLALIATTLCAPAAERRTDVKLDGASNSVVSGATLTIYGTLAIDAGATFTIPASLLTEAAADGTTKGIAAFTAADFNASSGVISLDYTNAQAASSSLKGFLTAADWTTFNGKFGSTTKAETLDAAFFAADAGSNDTYVATLSPAITAYTTGVHYRFKANTANTGAATINFNSVGAKTIKKAAGGITTDLADNDIRVGQWVDLVYDGTNMQMQSTLGNAASGGTGTVTHTGGALTSNAVVLGAGTDDTKVVAGITTDGTSALNLGVAGSSVGKVVYSNATSGTITMQPATGALGTITQTIPAASGTLFNSATTADALDAANFAADAGASDTYTATLSPAITGYTTGVHYRFKANTANTGAATINFNSIGAKTIKKAAGGITTDLADNDIRAGQWVDLVYDGTNMQMQSTLGNTASGGSGTITSSTSGQIPVYTGSTTIAGSSALTFASSILEVNATSPQIRIDAATSNSPQLMFRINGSDKGVLTMVGATNLFVTGNAVGDLVASTQGSNSLWLIPNYGSNSEWYRFAQDGLVYTKTGQFKLGASLAINSNLVSNAASTLALDYNAGSNVANILAQGTNGSTNGMLKLRSARSDGSNNIDILASDTSGNVTFAASIKTSAPSGSTARAFKVGDISSVTPTAQNRTLAVDVNGTVYYLTAKTTND